jgi:hypothetical protein
MVRLARRGAARLLPEPSGTRRQQPVYFIHSESLMLLAVSLPRESRLDNARA